MNIEEFKEQIAGLLEFSMRWSKNGQKRREVRGMDKIYDIGYGIAKWSGFFKRLLDADIGCVVDIRRAGSGSRNGMAFYWGSGPDGKFYMGDRLFEAGIEYFTIPELSKPKGLSMGLFRDAVYSAELSVASGLADGLDELQEIISDYGTHNICLLCCERDWKQCHRKIVAQFIAEDLGLEVVHL